MWGCHAECHKGNRKSVLQHLLHSLQSLLHSGTDPSQSLSPSPAAPSISNQKRICSLSCLSLGCSRSCLHTCQLPGGSVWGEGGGYSLRTSLIPSQDETDTSMSWFLCQLLFLGTVALWLHLDTLSFVGKGMGGLQLTSLLLILNLQHLISLMNIMHNSSSLKENTSVPDQPKHSPSSADQGSGAVGQQDKI